MKNLFEWCYSNNSKAFTSSSMGAFLAFITIMGFLHIKYQAFIEHVFIWISLIIILISIIAGLLTVIIRKNEEHGTCASICKSDDIFFNDLIDSLKKEFNKSKYQEVITIGHILSRPLFTIGKYELRLEIGEIVARSAVALHALLQSSDASQNKLNKYKEIEMIELIDSIGWMKVELGRIREGCVDIHNGLLIAESLNNDKGKFYMAKTFRHFGAIKRRSNDLEGALLDNDKSIEISNKIGDMQLKYEAIAAAHYARSFVYKEKNDYQNALKCLENSMLFFNKIEDGDKKIMKICMTKEAKARFLFYSKKQENDYNTISSAKTLFEETLTIAEHNMQRLEMVRCYIGLAEIYLHNIFNNTLESKIYIEKAKNININCCDDRKRIRDIEEILQQRIA